MEKTWFILSTRFGGDIPDPNAEELSAAIAEVYVEAHPSMTVADYEEHPSAFVRYGTDSGPMRVLYIGRSHAVTLEHWTNQDFEEELSSPLTIDGVSLEEAIGMCRQLQSGQFEVLHRHFQERGR